MPYNMEIVSWFVTIDYFVTSVHSTYNEYNSSNQLFSNYTHYSVTIILQYTSKFFINSYTPLKTYPYKIFK